MPNKMILNGKIISNQWKIQDATKEKRLVSINYWKENKNALDSIAEYGVIVQPNEGIDGIIPHLNNFSLIAINFPSFTDGRGYSYARALRETHQYKGEIRATGDILKDQMHYLRRCGFTAFECRDDRDIEQALASLHDFRDDYQADSCNPLPIYQREKR